MHITALRLVLLAALALPIACTQAQNDCKRNPELPCYEGSGGTAASGSGASGGGSGTKPLGTPCAAAPECTSGFCADGVCCDTACDVLCEACNLTAGTCVPLPAGEPDTTVAGDKICDKVAGGCGAIPGYCACEDGVQNVDETDVDCGGPTCNLCGVGDTCGTGTDCISGYCADGVCCGSTCGSQCVACNLPEKEGLCSLVPANTLDPQCSAGQVCNALGGLCAAPLDSGCSIDGQCASNNCMGNPQKCAACANNSECGDGKACLAGACYTLQGQGEPCIPGTCYIGLYCKDGICCETPCGGLCMACNTNYTGQPDGTCAPILAGYDPHHECPQPDPSQPGPGGSAFCSGAAPDGNGNSACATP